MSVNVDFHLFSTIKRSYVLHRVSSDTKWDEIITTNLAEQRGWSFIIEAAHIRVIHSDIYNEVMR